MTCLPPTYAQSYVFFSPWLILVPFQDYTQLRFRVPQYICRWVFSLCVDCVERSTGLCSFPALTSYSFPKGTIRVFLLWDRLCPREFESHCRRQYEAPWALPAWVRVSPASPLRSPYSTRGSQLTWQYYPVARGSFLPHDVRQGESLPHVIGDGRKESAKGIVRPPRTSTYRSL